MTAPGREGAATVPEAADLPAVAVCAVHHGLPADVAGRYWLASAESERQMYRAMARAVIYPEIPAAPALGGALSRLAGELHRKALSIEADPFPGAQLGPAELGRASAYRDSAKRIRGLLGEHSGEPEPRPAPELADHDLMWEAFELIANASSFEPRAAKEWDRRRKAWVTAWHAWREAECPAPELARLRAQLAAARAVAEREASTRRELASGAMVAVAVLGAIEDAKPAPELAAAIRDLLGDWREYASAAAPDDDAREAASREAVDTCVIALAAVLSAHPQPEPQPAPIPGDLGFMDAAALAARYGEALQRIVDVVTDPDAVDKLARNALGLTRVGKPSQRGAAQAAPELADAMRESRGYREALQVIAGYAAGTATKQMIATTARRALDNLSRGAERPVPELLDETRKRARAARARWLDQAAMHERDAGRFGPEHAGEFSAKARVYRAVAGELAEIAGLSS